MNNYIKTIISGLKQWVSTQITKSKSDWNQSDSSATNYVKNRTHYSEVGEIQVLPIKTLNNTSFSLKTPLVAGKKYTIAFNDVAYQCVAKDYNGYIMIGNNAVYEYDDGVETDTGEPFAIESNGIEAWIYLDDSVTSAPTVSIVFTGEIVHKLDKKYLPDSVVVSGDLADVATSGSYYDLPDAPDVSTVVKYSSQSLTTTQKAQARSNIGASDFSGNYNDLTNTPCNTITNRDILFGSSASSSSWSSGSGLNTKKYTFSNVNLLPGVKYEIVLRQQTTAIYTEQFTAKRVTYTSPAATMVAFGNASLYYNSTENTGEPVCAVYSENNFAITVYVDVDALGFTPTYIGVYRIEETVNQLDDKYIPSTIARAESVNTLVGDVPVAEQIENAIADIEKPVQSDWNESDQTSQAHILNRVCYEDYEYNEMVSGNLGTTLANGYYFKGQVVESNPITLGETYRVIYNGNEYMLESHECINDSNATIVYLGNAIILEKTSSNYTDMQDTGEPFVFTYSDITKTLSISAEDSGVPFTVEKQLSVLKQLDEKFIPDTIARVSSVNELNALVGDVAVSEQISTAIDEIPVVDNYKNGLMSSTDKKKLDTVESNAQKNVQSDWSQNDMTSMEFVQNRPFYDGPLSITWNGVTKGHSTHMYDSSNYLVKIANTTFTDEELQTAKFVINENGTTTEVVIADVWEDRAYTDALTGIWYNSTPCVYVVRQAGSLVGPGTYFLYNYSSKIYIQSLTIGSDTDIKKIDEKYIPDTIARASDVNNLSTLVGDTSVAEQISEATYTQSQVDELIAVVREFCLPKITSITLTESNWVFSANYYYQDVPVGVCTPTSKVDLQPTYSQLATWQDDGLAFTTQSKDGIVRVWAVPDAPREDITVQISVQEVLEV